jgi:alanine dehydrogenase
MRKLKIFSEGEVKQAVNMAQAIGAVKDAFIQLSRGDADIPMRTQVPVKKQDGVTLFMPAYLASTDTLGVKVVSVFPNNTEKELPTIHAIVILINAQTGQPQALMDGTYLTALRTGAASGLATDFLARRDARVAAIFGAGTQGRTQLEAVSTVRTIEKAWVYDIIPERAEAYVKEMKGRGHPIPSDLSRARTASQAVRDADIICTATTSLTPVFDDADLKPGAHINAVGSYTPQMQEIPAQTVARAKVVVDSMSASLTEAGDLIIPLKDGVITKNHIHGEIGQVAAGEITGREREEELTFFKSVGVAAQDAAVARLVLERAEELSLGTDIDL